MTDFSGIPMPRLPQRTVLSTALLLAGVFVALAAARADEPSTKDPAEEPFNKRLQAYFQKSAAEYQLFRDENRTQPLEFVPEAVFHWKQDNDWRGDVFVWTYEGRPEVVGGVFVSSPSGNVRTVYHEFRSLALKPIGTITSPVGSWTADTGIVLTPVPKAQAPALSESLRGAQLRQIAKDFTVTMKNDGDPWELRLLPKPLYRYSSPSQKVVDGALFAYVWTRGTDPECLLLLEARDEEAGLRWVYTPVRFTVRPLEMKHSGTSIWTSERDVPNPNRPEPGTSFIVGTLPLEEVPE
jgi:hypothetical protein